MSLTGILRISIKLEGCSIASVHLDLAEQIPVARLLTGLTPHDASARVKLLFSICGSAHAVAAQMAGEAIAGTIAPEQVQRTRSIIVAAEALREHASRILVDWAQLCGLKPDLAALKTVTNAFRSVQTAAEDRHDLTVLTAATLLLAKSIRSALDLDGKDAGSFANASLPLLLIAKIRAGQIVGTGSDPVDGTVYGRRMTDPRIEGGGVERRIRARLIEAQLLCEWLEDPIASSPLRMSARAHGPDHASVTIEVARGQLLHDVIMESGLIKHYRISAPTIANFSPGGAAETAIRNLNAIDRKSLEWLAKLSVLEVDPCVAHEVRIS